MGHHDRRQRRAHPGLQGLQRQWEHPWHGQRQRDREQQHRTNIDSGSHPHAYIGSHFRANAHSDSHIQRRAHHHDYGAHLGNIGCGNRPIHMRGELRANSLGKPFCRFGLAGDVALQLRRCFHLLVCVEHNGGRQRRTHAGLQGLQQQRRYARCRHRRGDGEQWCAGSDPHVHNAAYVHSHADTGTLSNPYTNSYSYSHISTDAECDTHRYIYAESRINAHAEFRPYAYVGSHFHTNDRSYARANSNRKDVSERDAQCRFDRSDDQRITDRD